MQGVTITVDNRERALKALFDDSQTSFHIEYKNLDLGDIIISYQSEDATIQLKCVFERKTIDDLQASIKDGRYHDQKKRLQDLDSPVFYIIEGGCTYSETVGAPIKSAIINTIVRDRIGVFRTVSIRDTYDLVCAIAKRVQETPEQDIQQNNTQQISGLASTVLSPAALSTNKKESVYVNMLCQIPGVSLKTAKAIEAVYPSWASLMTLATETEDEKLTQLEAITTCDSKGNTRKVSSSTLKHILQALF